MGSLRSPMWAQDPTGVRESNDQNLWMALGEVT